MAVVFTIDIEEGDLTDFDSTNGTNISVTAGAALVGSYGVDLDMTGTSSHYGLMTGVSTDLSAANNYRFRLYLDPNSVTMADGDNIWLVWGRDSTPSNMRLEVRFQKSGA